MTEEIHKLLKLLYQMGLSKTFNIFHYKITFSTALAVFFVVLLFQYYVDFILRQFRKRQLSQWAREAREKRDKKVHECLKNKVDKGTHKSLEKLKAHELIARCKEETISLEEYLHELAYRCHEYGRGTVNAITEEFYDEAIHNILDKNAKNSKGYLKNVPISLKDCFGQRSALQTGGLQCRTAEHYRGTKDSVLVTILRNQGALPFVRSNTVQLMMLAEAYNKIWGKTSNPWNLNRTPGGSSGGEAALIAMKCVPIGIGSDVAGSIRIPSSFCGVVGFKPTPNRISTRGCMTPRKNNQNGTKNIVPVCIGPIARCVEDCVLIMKAISSEMEFMNKKDSFIPPLKFRDSLYESKEKLRIGYFVTNNVFEPCPTAKRVILETVMKCRNAGYEVLEFQFPKEADCWKFFTILVTLNSAAGKMRNYTEALEGEDLISYYRNYKFLTSMPNFFRSFLSLLSDERTALILNSTRSEGISAYEYVNLCGEINDIRRKWDEAFEEQQLDALIFPSMPVPALHHGTTSDFTPIFSYPFMANLLLWPNGVVPVTVVKEDEQFYEDERNDRFTSAAKKCMEGSVGLPIGLSVMTRCWEDELCLRVMKIIEDLVQFSDEPTAYLRSKIDP